VVDIRKDASKPGNVRAFAVIILALGVLLFGGRIWSRVQPTPGKKTLEAVLFVTTQSMKQEQGVASASVAVEKVCDDLGIERRRLLAGQSTDNSETWLARMNVAGNADPPSLVFRYSNNDLETIPIPLGIEATVAAIEARK
jgi:hypothetical protein